MINPLTVVMPAPPDPALDRREAYASKASAFTLAMKQLGDELTPIIPQMNAAIATADASAVAAQAVVNAAMFDAATAYALGQAAISGVNFLTYRRKAAGTSATDPSADPANWALALATERYAGLVGLSGANALTVAHVGKLVYLLSVAGAITLPPANACKAGDKITLSVLDVDGFVIQRAGADIIYVNGLSAVASFKLHLGETVTLVCDGVVSWFAAAASQRSIGEGQSWASYPSRAVSTVYTNSTGRPIVVQIVADVTVAGNIIGAVDGVTAYIGYGTVNQFHCVTLVVPPGSTYQVYPSGSTIGVFSWCELR